MEFGFRPLRNTRKHSLALGRKAISGYFAVPQVFAADAKSVLESRAAARHEGIKVDVALADAALNQ
jgi:hypothetical protein